MTMFRGFLTFAIILSFLSGIPVSYSNEDHEALRRELEALKSKVYELEERLRQSEPPTAPSAPEERAEISPEPTLEPAEPNFSIGSQGVQFKSADGDFDLSLRGGVQFDSRFFMDDDLRDDTFLMRRVRPSFSATLSEHYSMRVQPDFAGSQTQLLDAHLDIRYWDEFQIRAGKFKQPLGLERLQSWPNLNFIERGFPSQILSNRDVGLQFYGDLFDRHLSYQVGVFNGTADGASSNTSIGDGKDFVGRLFAHPFRGSDIDALKGLGVGVSGSFGDYEGNLSSYRTPGQTTFFRYESGVTADGDQYRLSPQGYFYYGSFGLLGEYALSSPKVSSGGLNQRIKNDAWQIYANYVLTGENATYSGVRPSNPVDIAKGQWGAWELGFRYGNLSIDDDVFLLGLADLDRSAKQADEWTLALVWYLNQNAKVSLNYSHTEFKGGAANGRDLRNEDAIITRMQLAF